MSVFPPDQQQYSARLQATGYQSVFDIIANSRTEFLRSLPNIPAKEARQIYRQARQRAESLKSLHRAHQLRQEPVLNSLHKLTSISVLSVQHALSRSLGEDGDFTDLLTRSSEYADAASIQSLFSPGRYATALYKVAQTLHEPTSELHIDQRRPDLQQLILSEATLEQEVTALDILLSVLQGNKTDVATLANTYYPMTLPYDDSLAQIHGALSAQGRTLNGVGDMLMDTSRHAMSAGRMSSISRTVDEQKTGISFYLMAQKNGTATPIYLAHPTSGAGLHSAYLTLGKPQAVAVKHAQLMLTWVPGHDKKTLYLGVFGDVVINKVPLKDCFLTGGSGQEIDQMGKYARMVNKDQAGLTPAYHLAVTVNINNNGTVRLKTAQGYIGWEKGGPSNDWQDPLVLNADENQALLLTLCADNIGSPLEDLDSIFPIKVDTLPSPFSRNTLALTPASYQLLVKETPTLNDILSDYGLNIDTRTQASSFDVIALAEALNVLPTFCQRTGLTFNQVLELTAQQFYNNNGEDTGAPSRFMRFGEKSHTAVNRYGAVFLNGSLDENTESDGKYLWVQSAGTTLNFKADTVVDLAGRAEKLVRLRQVTGLDFESLDWLIVNANHAISGLTASLLLDRPVLDILAGFVSLRQRYGLDSNTFAALIGSVNPYAAEQTESFYQTTFTQVGTDNTIPLDELISLHNDVGLYENVCCQALGVTSDEFRRIGKYCLGNITEFRMTPKFAGQIYRFGAIPRMFGLTFAQAENLWKLMADGQDTLLRGLGSADAPNSLALIFRTEQVLHWLGDSGLSLLQLQGMVSREFSATATSEMFTFLQNVAHSVSDYTDETLPPQLQRALASGFGMKPNVMAQLLLWLENISVDTDQPFTAKNYWTAIQRLFTGPDTPSFEVFQQDVQLVIWTQQLSQLVLIGQWLNLTEQDLSLLTATPLWLNEEWFCTPVPSLELLQLLSRYKQWQHQVTVSRDEAVRLLAQLNEESMVLAQAISLVAALHDVNEGTVEQMNQVLSGSAWPTSFSALWHLLTWLRVGQSLNVGSQTLDNLMTMMQPNVEAEQADLLSNVAQSLSAGLSPR